MIGTLVNISKILIQKRELIWQMSKRDVMGRYKGSFLGLAWSLFNPILMLTVYTFVFSVIFKSRWGNTQMKVMLILPSYYLPVDCF
jgi:lipopolysaccharide transport system permease protein